MTTIEIMDTSWDDDDIILHVLQGDTAYSVRAEFIWNRIDKEVEAVLSPAQPEHGRELAAYALDVRESWMRNSPWSPLRQ
jgi:hypothetical protein